MRLIQGGNLPRRYNGRFIHVKENAIPHLACLDCLFTGPPLERQEYVTALCEAEAAIRAFQGRAACPSAGQGTHELPRGCTALTPAQTRVHGVFFSNGLPRPCLTDLVVPPTMNFIWPCRLGLCMASL